MLRHSIPNRDSLRACSNRIRGILDVGAGDDGAAGQEQGAADVEVGVGAFLGMMCQLAMDMGSLTATIMRGIMPGDVQ